MDDTGKFNILKLSLVILSPSWEIWNRLSKLLIIRFYVCRHFCINLWIPCRCMFVKCCFMRQQCRRESQRRVKQSERSPKFLIHVPATQILRSARERLQLTCWTRLRVNDNKSGQLSLKNKRENVGIQLYKILMCMSIN